jgi:hypothetical protein
MGASARGIRSLQRINGSCGHYRSVDRKLTAKPSSAWLTAKAENGNSSWTSNGEGVAVKDIWTYCAVSGQIESTCYGRLTTNARRRPGRGNAVTDPARNAVCCHRDRRRRIRACPNSGRLDLDGRARVRPHSPVYAVLGPKTRELTPRRCRSRSQSPDRIRHLRDGWRGSFDPRKAPGFPPAVTLLLTPFPEDPRALQD